MNSNPEAKAVKQALIERAEDLFRAAWGEPAKAGAKEWRAKASSARVMVMSGPKRGAWADHKAGTFGDALDFFAAEFCGLDKARADFPRVIEEAARWCGLILDSAPDLAGLQARRDAQRAQDAIAEAQDAQAKARLVSALQARSAALAGSPAAAYLASRGVVDLPPAGLAYLPPVPGLGVPSPERGALVVWATDDAGRARGGQRVLVLPDGSKAPEDVRKPAFGAITGFPARFPARIEGGPLVICEGPETALSVWQATGFETWAVFGAGQFKSAPIPTGCKAILCPDRDARDSPAGEAFRRGVAHHAERGCDLWIAEAPEPEGSKQDLSDTLQRAGAVAVAQAIEAARQVAPFARAVDGRFTGRGAVAAEPVAMPGFVTVAEAQDGIRGAVADFLQRAADWGLADEATRGPAPVLAVAAYPGTGKSRITREALAGFHLRARGGDVMFHAPTLALADEAAAHAAELGAGWHVTRGRSAKIPGGDGAKMCARAELAELVAKAGKRVYPSLCERETDNGETVRCPHFDGCAYLRQWADLGESPVLRFESHAYLPLSGDGSHRKTGLRVVDEAAWGLFTRTSDLSLDGWTGPRWPAGGRGKRAQAQAAERAVDATTAAGEVLAALQRGDSPVLDRYTTEDFGDFAAAERGGEVLAASPAASDADIAEALAEMGEGSATGKRAAVWAILADCKQRGLSVTERLRLVRDVPCPGSGARRDVIRATWFTQPPRDVPVLILDADADPVILERMYPGAELVRFNLRPNAHVVQVSDHTFSKAALIGSDSAPKGKAARNEIVDLVRAEVWRDRVADARGVLAVASRKVVRRLFEDAGHDFSGKADAEISDFMRTTELHGARWLWFGPASLGRNDWQDFGTAVVIGREQVSLQALQDTGRALFGDTGAALDLIEEKPGANLPEAAVPYLMADGSGRAVNVRVHPDARLQAVQWQSRENATRQAFERLRLATSPERKRVVLACKVPISGLPVDELMAWTDLRPSRLQAAIAEAAQQGEVLRLSAAGLAADAPETFATAEAARLWLRDSGTAEIKWGGAGNKSSISGATLFNPVWVRVRLEGQRGRATPALVILPGDPRALAEAQLGPLAMFELVPKPDAEKQVQSVETQPVTATALVSAEIVPADELIWARAARYAQAATAVRKRQEKRRAEFAAQTAPRPPARSDNLADAIAPRPARRLRMIPRVVPFDDLEAQLGQPVTRYAVEDDGPRLIWWRGIVDAVADVFTAWRGTDDPDAWT